MKAESGEGIKEKTVDDIKESLSQKNIEAEIEEK
jgi:hypothetical protein